MNTSEEELYKHVNYFTGFNPHRHFGNLTALNECAGYIHSFFSSTGLTIQTQNWDARGNEYKNIIASLYPDKLKRLIVGAHYDVYADNPGADDNASGMAGLLESAKLIAAAQPDLDYGIDFVAYCLEEPPFFGTPEMGSYIHASSISENKENIIGMICYDMIGYFSEETNTQNFPNAEMAALFPSKGNFILVVGTDAHSDFSTHFQNEMNSVNRMDVQLINFHDSSSLAGLSDHRNYWHYGMKALMINNSAFLRNPNYHEKTDTIDTLDFNKMKLVVEAATTAMTTF
ncbi:MAG: Zn-dependent M28 family amino/carboxypeptidase [Arenicella sp.]